MTSSPTASDPAQLVSIAAATLVAAVLRGFHLGRQSLWIDEVFTWLSAGGGGAFGIAEILENVHGPLYSVVLHGWAGLAGTSEFALRVPSAVFGTLTVPAMAWLGARWVGRDVAVPAAWLAACSPFLVWYAQELRNYSLLILLTTTALGLLFGLRDRLTARGAALYVAASAGAMLSNLSFALSLPLHLRWWLVAADARRRGAWLILAAIAWLVIASPWLPGIVRTWDWRRLSPAVAGAEAGAPLRGETTMHVGAVPFALHAFSVGYSFGPSLRELRSGPVAVVVRRHLLPLAVAVLLFATLLGLGLRGLARRGRLADGLIGLGAPMLIVSYFALQNFKVFHPRYVAVAFPIFLLVLAVALADARGWVRRGLIAALAAIWGVALFQHAFDPAFGKEDYRGALAFIRASMRPEEQVLAVGCEEPVFHYAQGMSRVSRFWLGHAADTVRLQQKLDAALTGAPGTWVVLSRAEDLDPGDAFARLLARQHPTAGTWSRPGVRIWHLDTSGAAAPTP